MRMICSLFTAVTLLFANVDDAAAQRVARQTAGSIPPLRVSVRVPTSRPDLTLSGLLLQTGAGLAGGFAGFTVVAIPMLLVAWDSPDFNETALLAVGGAAFLAGTVAATHYVGRRQGMMANPWATLGGVLVGATLGGATLQVDDEGYAESNVFVIIGPAVGGTVGYALTRRFADPPPFR